MADASLSDFAESIKELAKAQRNTNDTLKTISKDIGQEVLSGVQGIISPITSALSSIPGFREFMNIGKLLGKQLISKIKEKREMELLRKQLGLNKVDFKLKLKEKKVADAVAEANSRLESAAESLLGMSRDEIKDRRFGKKESAVEKKKRLK